MRIHPAFLGGLIALIIVLAGTLVIRQSGITISINGATPVARMQAQQVDSGKELYYSTMHPWIVQDHPGSCPICGMELVKMPKEMQAEWERNHKAA